MSQLALQSDGGGSSDAQVLSSSASWPIWTAQESPGCAPSTRTQAAAPSSRETVVRALLSSSPSTAASSIANSGILAVDTNAFGKDSSSLRSTGVSNPGSPPSLSPTPTPTVLSARYLRKPLPSPLQTTTFVSPSPSTSPSPTTSDLPSPVHGLLPHASQSIDSAAQDTPLSPKPSGSDKPYFQGGASPPASEKSFGSTCPSRVPNDCRSASDSVLASQPSEGLGIRPSLTMAGPRVEAAKGPPRNSSIDSAISAISSSSHSHKNASDAGSSPADINNLIKAAGSAEAVIQYLLKEKASQAQQNAQLWRLVDKQRAMILGLNKDLERALKDKEKYRKKLKEVMGPPQVPPLPTLPTPSSVAAAPAHKARHSEDSYELPKLAVPVSPTLDSDSVKHSPIDVSLAPYPITPPADQPMAVLPTAVGDMLDPTHSMPKPEEYALDQYDHEEEEREAERARKEAEEAELPLNLPRPPTRSPPSEPPRMPPPQPPVPAAPAGDSTSQFPPPPAPPPRKPPPAPLRLENFKKDDEADESADSDLDELIGAKEDADSDTERRGRRRTRREDDEEREIMARKEAEMRSLSKKSRKSSSSKNTPMSGEHDAKPSDLPASPRTFPAGVQAEPASLAGILNGTDREVESELVISLAMPSGLPASPRPFGGAAQNMSSPPHSPRSQGAFSGVPLSPRPPRQVIPLPPNTPQYSPPTVNAEGGSESRTPKQLNIVKKAMDALSGASSSPTKVSRDTPEEESKVYTGFITEEYPDLLLPPNALPSVDIKVASSRMKPSRASLLSLTQLEEDPVFTLAIFSRAEGNELWRVEKDSLSLAKLDQRLKQCPAFTAKTPDRSLFSGHAPAKLDARRQALDQYLDELLNSPLDTATAIELCKYLSTNTLPPNADETGSADVSPKSANPQKTGPGGRPFRSGYLTKRGKNFGGWKARFFVLDGPQLKYYETPGGAHLGTIKLQNAQIGKQSQSNDNASPARTGGGTEEIDNQYRHAFLILEPKKKDPSVMTKHVLCAESDKERDMWVDALLRWIDYRDPEDEEASRKEAAQPERAAAASSSKKKKSASRQAQSQQQQQQQQQHTESDTLISVSYDDAQQGEAPTHGAPGRKTGHNDHEALSTPMLTPLGMSSQQAYAISGPRDPQPISDSAAWGSRTPGLLPPDEKKARKRSFFGFKARTSSDGNDSLFGGDSNSSSALGSSAPNAYPGPLRQVFGAPLSDAVRYNSPMDVKVPLPAVVYRCIQYMESKNAIAEEGIFRLSGSNVVIKQLRERFNSESDVDLVADSNYHDIHAVASLLKLYLRELPTTILTRDLHMHFLSVTEMPNSAAKIAALSELVERLPQANATLLKYLIAFLIKIINNAGQNKMTVRNVGIVFSPTLNIPAPVFAMFLQNYEGIFGIDPEEYELPVPGQDHAQQHEQQQQQPRRQHQQQPQQPQQQQQQQQQQHQQYYDDAGSERSVNARPAAVPRRPSLASLEQYQGRPSTSGTSGSPHRQRLVESVGGNERQQQRSSRTPPPVGQYNTQARSSSAGTPPPQQQQRQVSYEPQYLAQQNMQSVGVPMALRPAYEGGSFVPQTGMDMSQLHTPTGPRVVNPGYDRPLYEQNMGGFTTGPAAYEGPFANSGVKSRRESAVFMMNGLGMSHQSSRSRLREETHF